MTNMSQWSSLRHTYTERKNFITLMKLIINNELMKPFVLLKKKLILLMTNFMKLWIFFIPQTKLFVQTVRNI